MAEEKLIRLSQAARKLNVGHNTILDFLTKKGFEVDNNPNAKLTPEQVALLSKEFASSATEKLEASGLSIGVKHGDAHIESEKETAKKRVDDEESNIMIKNLGSNKDLKMKEEVKLEKVEREKPKLEGIKVVGKIELEKKAPVQEEIPEPKKIEPVAEPVAEVIKVVKKEEPKQAEPKVETPIVEPVQAVIEKLPEQELIKGRADKLQGLKVVDRIQLPVEKDKKKDAPVASSDTQKDKAKRPRKRISSFDNQPGQQQPGQQPAKGPRPQPGQQQRRPAQAPRVQKAEPTEKEIQDQIRATLAKLS